MKSRIIWAAVLLTAIAGFYVATIRPTNVSSPGFSRKRPLLKNLRPPEIPPPELPAPVFATPTLRPPLVETSLPSPTILARRDDRVPMQMEVPIQNGATIDFTYHNPNVRSGGKDQEALDRALKEMAEATKDVKFEPTKK